MTHTLPTAQASSMLVGRRSRGQRYKKVDSRQRGSSHPAVSADESLESSTMSTQNALTDGKIVVSKRDKLEKKATTETDLLISMSGSHGTINALSSSWKSWAMLTSLMDLFMAANTISLKTNIPDILPLR